MDRVDFKSVQAALRFQAEAKTRVRDEFGFDQPLSNADGTLSLTAHFSSMDRAIAKILSYGSMVKVLEPPALVAELQRQIRMMAELYEP